jgi:UDP-GlcNAc:undecaprenyl-phosphate/decaprenyl-phosphate GlcNAc-1-phosphate transferase
VAALLPHDLRERAMLGDAGAYAMGALVGAGVVYQSSDAWFRLILLGVLAALTLVADGPGLGRVIDATPLLRSFDRAGRMPETDIEASEQAIGAAI